MHGFRHPLQNTSAGGGWCRVGSLNALAHQIQRANASKRLLIIGCVCQLAYWEQLFASVARSLPRVMFATIHNDDLNVRQPQPPVLDHLSRFSYDVVSI